MVTKGQKVLIAYVGKLEDGTIFDSTEANDEPFDFIVGGGNVIPDFEEAVLDMEVGDKKTIVIPAERAFGKYDPNQMDSVPLEELAHSEDIVQRVGQTICFDDEKGNFVEALIVSVNDGKVTLDFNHPLAGHALTFDIELLSVKDAHKAYAKPVKAPEMPLKPGQTN